MRHGAEKTYREVFLIQKGWGDREDKTRSYRWPRRIIERVDKIARETMNEPSDALFYLVEWACDEYEMQREKERKEKKG